MNQYYKDREDAAAQLMDALPIERIRAEKWKIIAVSAGGLKIASIIAARTNTDVDILFSQAIYAPSNAECELGRVSETEEIVVHEELIEAFDIQYDYIYGEAHRKHEEKILASIYQFRKGVQFPQLKDEHVLLIDEGCESGMKLMTGIKTAMNMDAKAVFVAIPVAPRSVAQALNQIVDESYIVHEVNDYVKTYCYYKEFAMVSDKDIEEILEKQINN
ncbi:phosphoribosyltransferase [Sulfurimonas sp. MAG313]|nr:phosphoribosyltransferase [Sulfurimonas sp. MAG313]MDF1882065.1 phosphoribosyltransferase [Sulfurimonas sp. MAG313]